MLAELQQANDRLAYAPPSDVVRWVYERFGDDTVFACSFEDVALLHLVLQQHPAAEVLFLDTEGHFPETYDFVAAVEREWSVHLTRTQPGPEAAASPCGTADCCRLRKVEPLARAVRGRAAWVSAIKRVDAPTRSDISVVSWDEKFGLVKANPLANWTDDDVMAYLEDHGLPRHPLWDKGYASIGCAAMTQPTAPGADRRSGRWVGLDKLECGLHEG